MAAPLSLTAPASWPRAGQWAVLLGLSVAIAVPLELVRLPAALLLGPMLAGIVMGVRGASIRAPGTLFLLAQAVVGCMMARALPAGVFVELAADWPLYAFGVFSMVLVSAGIGIVLTRWQVLPGTTAIWGAAPGAAAAMTLLADEFGADSRLVAFMAYTRMVLVAALAAVIAGLVGAGTGGAAHDFFPPLEPAGLAVTVTIIAANVLVVKLFNIRAGAVVLPMLIGVVAQNVFGLPISLPPVLLVVSYALVGWSIGLRYTPEIVRHARRALPAVLGAIVLLVASCGLFALGLVWFAGVDPLTAYLATSPGGADSVAIIATSVKVDVPFVMAMQTGRFMVVLLTGPALARWLAGRAVARGEA